MEGRSQPPAPLTQQNEILDHLLRSTVVSPTVPQLPETKPYSTTDFDQAAQTLAQTSRNLYAKGWSPATSSNYSQRLSPTACAITTSGSVKAQKLFFGYSDCGDIQPWFTHHFDTTTSPKKETASYQKIATALQLPPPKSSSSPTSPPS